MTSVAFILSMPGRNSWDGRWSGEGTLYCIVRKFSDSSAGKVLVESFMHGKQETLFSHNFGDGWRASVAVRVVKGNEIVSLRRRSKGFCGYDWMVNSIVNWGAIYTENPGESK